VLTPARLPQRLDEAPNAMTVIDRAMIEASGARRLAEVLRLVPGIQVGYKYNNQPTIAYHGLSDEFARRVLVLVNGQRIFQYSGGGVDWNNLPIPLQDHRTDRGHPRSQRRRLWFQRADGGHQHSNR